MDWIGISLFFQIFILCMSHPRPISGARASGFAANRSTPTGRWASILSILWNERRGDKRDAHGKMGVMHAHGVNHCLYHFAAEIHMTKCVKENPSRHMTALAKVLWG